MIRKRSAESPKLGHRKNVGAAVFGVDIDLLGVKPVYKETEAIKVDIGEGHCFRGSFREVAVEGRGEEGRVVADEVFVDDESFLRILWANYDRHDTLRASIGYHHCCISPQEGVWLSAPNGAVIMLGRSYLRLGAFFSDASGLMVRLGTTGAGDCENRGAPPIIVDVEAGDGVVAFVVISRLVCCSLSLFC